MGNEMFVHSWLVQVTVKSDGVVTVGSLRNIPLISKMVPHAYRVELEHCMHMSLCGNCVLDYVKDAYMALCIYVKNV